MYDKIIVTLYLYSRIPIYLYTYSIIHLFVQYCTIARFYIFYNQIFIIERLNLIKSYIFTWKINKVYILIFFLDGSNLILTSLDLSLNFQ